MDRELAARAARDPLETGSVRMPQYADRSSQFASCRDPGPAEIGNRTVPTFTIISMYMCGVTPCNYAHYALIDGLWPSNFCFDFCNTLQSTQTTPTALRPQRSAQGAHTEPDDHSTRQISIDRHRTTAAPAAGALPLAPLIFVVRLAPAPPSPLQFGHTCRGQRLFRAFHNCSAVS